MMLWQIINLLVLPEHVDDTGCVVRLLFTNICSSTCFCVAKDAPTTDYVFNCLSTLMKN